MNRTAQFFIITTVLVAGALLVISNTFAASAGIQYDSVISRHDPATLSNVADNIRSVWWNGSWLAKTTVVVQERSGSYLNNETIPIVLNAPTRFVNDDCSDIRVVDHGTTMPWRNTTPCIVETYSSDTTAVAHYRMDEGRGGWTNDSTDNGNNGQFSGDPDWVTGRFAAGVDFDGSGDSITVPNDPSQQFDDELTITAFIRPSATGSNQQWIMEQSNTFGSAIDSTNTLSFTVATSSGATTLTSTAPITTDVWQHVALVYDGTEMRIYLDGREQGSTTKSGTLQGVDGVYLGGDVPGSQDWYNGVLDDVRIYNRSLGPAHINGIARGGIGINLSADLSPGERKQLDIYLDNDFAVHPQHPSSHLTTTPFADPDNQPNVLEIGSIRSRTEIMRNMERYITDMNQRIGAELVYQRLPGCDLLYLRSPEAALEHDIC